MPFYQRLVVVANRAKEAIMSTQKDIISVNQNKQKTSLDNLIVAWLDEKVKHTSSAKTEDAYTDASTHSVLC